MTSPEQPRHFFDAYGIELEYMIVHKAGLDVAPIADAVLEKAAGHVVNEVEREDLAWSNELALHVIELKTVGPVPSLSPLSVFFQKDIGEINGMLKPMGARLMPTAMHPWMDPERETKLWPHGDKTIYQTYDRIFSCRGHGWSNLQSVHLNLGFSGDEEFGRLHTAVRLLLPILPAIAASSPVMAGRPTGYADTRLRFYKNNQARVPSVTGAVIPDAVLTKEEYERRILIPMYEDIAPLDPEGILRNEWLNSRGAIARFERNAIEIRLLDVQECPLADIALCHLIVETLKKLVMEEWSSWRTQQSVPSAPLVDIFTDCIQKGEDTLISSPEYLQGLGVNGPAISAGALWRGLAEKTIRGGTAGFIDRALEHILRTGPLSRRIMDSLGPEPDRKKIVDVYARLCDCLEHGELFHA